MPLNFHQLRCFDAVAQHGGFTSAAKALFVGQPSVTTHIKGLESRFDTELFFRRGQAVQLTTAGARLFEITQQIFELESKAEETLREASSTMVGELRIAAFNPVHAAQMAAAFSERYPGVTLSVQLCNTEEMMASLFSFNADVATLPCMNDSRIYSEAYGRASIVLLVSRDHPWSTKGAVTLTELEGQKMVSRETGSLHQRLFHERLTKAGVQVRTVLKADSQEAVREAVAAGLGFGVELEPFSQPDPRLVSVGIPEGCEFPELQIACLQERRDSPLVRAFFHSACTSPDASRGVLA
jgi:aminoethylphosphonate catabolism LysR family transcriptional regulator